MASTNDNSPPLNARALRKKAKETLTRNFTEPVAGLLAGLGISPNKVTIAGALLGMAAGHTIARGHQKRGGLLVLAAGMMDALDGALARLTGESTKFGLVLDATLDRFSEGAALSGLLIQYARKGATFKTFLVYGTLLGSVLVSYIRARSESVGISCDVGVLTRSERTIILALGLLLGRVRLALWVLSVLSYLTALQRLLEVRRASDREEQG